jgi:hypothetical protein
MILEDGTDAVRALVQARTADDPQPIPPEHFVALSAWLANGHDPSGAQRHELAQLRVRLYPRSARAHLSLGVSAHRLGNAALARTHLDRAMTLLAVDQDIHLDPPTVSRIRGQIAALLADRGR